MGQKVNPVGFRTGVVIGWKSRWYASKKEFAELLVEDQKIRKFIKDHPDARFKMQYRNAGIDRIEIERTRDEVRVMLFVARPGLIIGKKGQDVEKLQEELQSLIGRRVNLKIEEVGRPELQAQLVADDIAQQLMKRTNFRRTMKRALETTMDAGAKGIKVQLAGRLGGAEMARREKASAGSLPLSTLMAKIDYGFSEAQTPQGNLGIQVWVNQGSHAGDSNDGADAQAGQASKKPKRSYKR
ncbi:MAG: 30S ribosomal protein S3 [Pirellulaceae bacterium]|jgi:small subunit ribosomal protein S3|nr:30S ribosomal protein S3 [Planctomycetales bacterium]MCC7338344.1 30S ribosomal protein S3 [Pirellulaceae bacterium]